MAKSTPSQGAPRPAPLRPRSFLPTYRPIFAGYPCPFDSIDGIVRASAAVVSRCLGVTDQPRCLILAARAAEDELSLMAGSNAPQTLPVANRPLIAHGLEAALASGSTDTAVVVSPRTATDVRATVEGLTSDGPLAGLRVSFITCDTAPTLPAALVEARQFLTGDRFIVQLADSLILPSAQPALEANERGEDDVTIFVRRSTESQRRDAASLAVARRGLHLVGNPPPPPPDQALAGMFVFGKGAIEAADELLRAGAAAPPEVSELLSALRRRGGEFELRPVRDSWKYSGDVDELLAANRMVLDDLEPEPIEADLSSAQIEGRVAIHRTAVLERTTVRGPAVIGPGAVLLDTFVGPYTAIGENVRVEGAELEYSIVLPNASIRHPGSRLEASLVGQGARIARDFSLPSSLRLRVGSRADISLS